MIVQCCTNELCCTLIMQACSAVFALFSCLALSLMSNIDTVLMDRVTFFLYRLVYIHSADDLLKKPQPVISSRKWAQQTRWTQSCISFTDAQNKHRCHESAFDDQSSWCSWPLHVNHQINKLFVLLPSVESSWMSISTFLQQSTLKWWIYFSNRFHGILWCCSPQYYHLVAETEEFMASQFHGGVKIWTFLDKS